MKVTRFKEPVRYDVPDHRGFIGLRLQGFERGRPEEPVGGNFAFPAGCGAGPDSSAWEKVYVCLAGNVTVIIDGVETVLNSMDSLTVAPHEVRETINRENDVATTLVVMPYPPA